MIRENENLHDTVITPIVSLVLYFKMALQYEYYEFCTLIKAEMDRRQRLHKINKEALKKLLNFIYYNDVANQEDKNLLKDMFENYL